MTLKALSPEQAEQFERDGYCVVPALLSRSESAHVRAYYARVAGARSSGARSGGGPEPGAGGDPAAWDRDQHTAPVLRKAPAPFDNDPGFREIFGSPRVLDLVEDLIGPSIYLHSSKLLFKPARSGRRKPMHQDLAYWTDMTERQVTLWCAIDPATPERGGLELIPGSHRRALLPHEDLEDYQVREETLDLDRARPAVMEAGDALFLDVLTVHASTRNESPHDRLAAVVNYYSRPKSAAQTSPYGSAEALRLPLARRP